MQFTFKASFPRKLPEAVLHNEGETKKVEDLTGRKPRILHRSEAKPQEESEGKPWEGGCAADLEGGRTKGSGRESLKNRIGTGRASDTFLSVEK